MSLSIEVSIHGLEFNEVEENLIIPLRQKLVERLAEATWASAFWSAPRKTGKLSSTIVKEVGSGEASIGILAPYALYVVKGTRPHIIKPANASVLAFEAASGKLVFTRLVHHPGTKPNPFMQQAAEYARNKAEEIFAELWLELT